MGAYAANMLDRRIKRHERYTEHLRIAIEALLAGTPIVDSIPPERAYSSFYAMLNRMRTIPTVESAYTMAAASGAISLTGLNLDLAQALKERAWSEYHVFCASDAGQLAAGPSINCRAGPSALSSIKKRYS